MTDENHANGAHPEGGIAVQDRPAPATPKPAKAPATDASWKGTGKAKPADLVDLAAVLRDRYAPAPAAVRQATMAAVEAVLFDPVALAAVLAIVAAGSGTRADYDDAKRLALRQLTR